MMVMHGPWMAQLCSRSSDASPEKFSDIQKLLMHHTGCSPSAVGVVMGVYRLSKVLSGCWSICIYHSIVILQPPHQLLELLCGESRSSWLSSIQEAIVCCIIPSCSEGHTIEAERVSGVLGLRIQQSALVTKADQGAQRSMDGCLDGCYGSALGVTLLWSHDGYYLLPILQRMLATYSSAGCVSSCLPLVGRCTLGRSPSGMNATMSPNESVASLISGYLMSRLCN